MAAVAAKGEGRDNEDIATVASEDAAADARELMRDGLELH